MMAGERPTRVVVDGFELNTVEPSGVEWRFEKAPGWLDGVGNDVDQTQRIVTHGQFGQPGHRTGRLFTITGRIYAPRELMPDAIDRLNAILADGGFGRFEFHDRIEGERWTTVQLGPNSIRATPWDGSPSFAYQLELLSPSSFKYGTTSTATAVFAMDPVGAGLVFPLFPAPSTLDFGAQGTTGTATVTNPGKAPATVRFTVDGPTPDGGFMITDTSTGKTIAYLGAVPLGSQLVLDSATGTVTIDDVADRGGDTIVQAWPTVPAGGSRDFLFTPIGGNTAAVLTAECVATYW